MLEEGKITSEEALRLLEALDNNEEKIKDDLKSSSENKFNDTINKFSKKAEKFAEKFGPDFVSRVENVSSDFADAAVKFADKMVGFFSNGFSSTEIYKTISRNYSFPVNSLEKMKVILKTQNLSVSTSTTEAEVISLNFRLNLFDESVDIDSYMTIESEGNLIHLNTNFPSKIWGKLDIELPINLEALEIETSNSKCHIEDLNAASLYCNTSNGKIEIEDCNCENLNAKTNNGKILISKCRASYAIADTSNGNIEIEDSGFDSLKSITSNSSIFLSRFNSISTGEAKFDLQTSNGKIKIALSKYDGIAYKINAKTSLGNINTSELEPSFIIDKNNSNMKAEAYVKSSDYESSDKKIIMDAVTSNSSINILSQ